ncbi:MAG: thioredoxin domain-containing protein [Acidobacteriota bacterium]
MFFRIRPRWIPRLGFSLVTLALDAFVESAVAGDRAAATVNGEVILLDQLESVIRKYREESEQRLRAVRESVLDRLIDGLLLSQAARKAAITPEEYLKKHLAIAAVDDVQVEQAFLSNKERFPGMIDAEVKYRVRRELEDRSRAEALTALFRRLRAESQIEIMIGSELERTKSALKPPFVLVQFSDYLCSACQAAEQRITKVVSRLDGRIERTVKQFPGSSVESQLAAKAAICAQKEGQFWEVHPRLFGLANLTEDVVLQLGLDGNIDAATLRRCLHSRDTETELQQNISTARSKGVSGTPTYFLNDIELSLEKLEDVLTQEAAKPNCSKCPPASSGQ